MIFQATWRQVLAGTKTQTRRIVKEAPRHLCIGGSYSCELHLSRGEWSPENLDRTDFPGKGVYLRTGIEGGWLSADCCAEPEWSDRAKWIEGKTYAVQPGRTQKAVGRIRITRIRQERVQDITEADVEAEGVGLQAWAGEGHEGWPRTAGYAQLWDSLHDRPGERWADNPAVWVLEFELVEKR